MKTKIHHKADVTAKLKPAKPVYNLMVGYDPILETEIRNILRDNNIETKITTEIYFYMKDLDEKEVQKIRDLVKDVKFEFKSPKTGNLKVYKVRYISATLAPEMNLGKLKRIRKKKLSGTIHSSGSNRTSREKKIAERVKKACKYLDKAKHHNSKKKTLASVKKAKFRASRPVQQKLNFKAAA